MADASAALQVSASAPSSERSSGAASALSPEQASSSTAQVFGQSAAKSGRVQTPTSPVQAAEAQTFSSSAPPKAAFAAATWSTHTDSARAVRRRVSFFSTCGRREMAKHSYWGVSKDVLILRVL